jgi:uncharacterized protein
MKCPTCTDVTLVIADRSGIEIDYCPQCRGVWLDRGELDRLIDRAANEAVPARRPPRDWDDDRRYEYDRDREPSSRKRRKSFLDDLFDF